MSLIPQEILDFQLLLWLERHGYGVVVEQALNLQTDPDYNFVEAVDTVDSFVYGLYCQSNEDIYGNSNKSP